jgi:hypothetical protein
MLALTLFSITAVVPEPDGTFCHMRRLLSLAVMRNMTLQQHITAAHQRACYQPEHCQEPIICYTATAAMCIDLMKERSGLRRTFFLSVEQ